MITEDDVPSLLVNRWLCSDGYILQSKHRHDYVDHVGKDNQYYSVDGGTMYVRVSGQLTSLCLYTDDPHEEIRLHFYWGSYLRDFSGDKHFIPLFKLGDSHIQAILDTQSHISEHIRAMFIDEQEYRVRYGINVQETIKD